MIDFINNLNSREKKLLLAVSALIFLIIFWIIISNLFGEFKISKQNLNKSKSDYEYVYKKANMLKKTYLSNNLELDLFLQSLNKDAEIFDIKNLAIKEIENGLSLQFQAENRNRAIEYVVFVTNNNYLQPSKLNIKKGNDIYNVVFEIIQS